MGEMETLKPNTPTGHGIFDLGRTKESGFPRASQERNVVSFVSSGKHKAESNLVSINSQ